MDDTTKIFVEALQFSTSLVAVIFAVHAINYLTGMSMQNWGIYPREIDGLAGVITAPLIHGSWEHLFSNAAPILVTTTITHFFYKRVALTSFIFIYLITGVCVWLFGRPAYHIGASGVVYGLVSFIFWSGIFRRNIKSIILALIVTILYSGYISGIIPFKEGVSWESHLIGGIVGILVAFLFKGIIEDDEERTDPSWANDPEEETVYYLPRDAFEMTKHERYLLEEERKRILREQYEQNQNLTKNSEIDPT